MRAAHSAAEREHRRGLLAGGLVVVLVALVVYPPLFFGGVPGACLGLGLSRRGAEQRPTASTLLAVGFVLAIVLVLGDLAGLAGERRTFIEAWAGAGPLQLELTALVQHPWAWLPQTIAIGSLAAGAMSIAVRGR